MGEIARMDTQSPATIVAQCFIPTFIGYLTIKLQFIESMM